MFSAVKLPGFVALDIVKSNAPSPFVVSLVILIVGGPGSFVFSKIHSTVSPRVTVKSDIVPREMLFFSQSIFYPKSTRNFQ